MVAHPKAMTPPERTHKRRRRLRRMRWGDLYTELAGQYGDAFRDRIKSALTVFDFQAARSLILDDLDLWFEATGERLGALTERQHLALEAWLWEAHDRVQDPDRWKPNKSPEHDAPWPGAVNWAPRRWFGPSPSGAPLEISI